MLFPKINNLQGIIVKEHPTLHPDSKAYLDYWRDQKKKCIEGLWYEDLKDQWRYCYGPLYFYANMGTIIRTDHKSKSRKKSRPFIRDVEWIIFTDYIIARGFSGFEDDDEYSSNYAISYNDTDNLTPNCYNKSGKLKTFISPLENLHRLHSKPLGRPLYENEASNVFVLGSRGLGKSYCVAHIIACELLMDGQKTYDINNKSKAEIFVGAFKADKSSELLSKVELILSELPGSYGKGKDFRPSPLYKEMSGTLKNGNTKSPFEHKYKKRENGTWVTAGSGSKILHEVFTIENPQAAAGSRPILLVIEEVGLLPNIKEVHGSNTAAQITEGKKMGTSIYIGTGGNMDKIVDSEYMFRRPKDYNIVAHVDEWESTGEIGLFIPVQYTYEDLKDENGNTNLEKANKRAEAERKGKKWDALQHQKMNYPTTPSEMFLSSRGNVFPQDEIQRQLKYVVQNKDTIDRFTSYGTLVYDAEASYGVSFKPDVTGDWTPLIDYPTKKGTALKGAVVIYEHPPDIIPERLYKIVYDPVKDDEITEMGRGVSLAAVYVYKSVQKFDGLYDQIVAHYVGRFPNTDDVHDMAIKLSIYYNAKIMPEMNLPGFYKYCLSTKRLNAIAPTPFVTIGRVDPNGRQRLKLGIYMNTALIIQAEQYLIRWLLEERDVILDEAGNVKKVKRNIDFIYDKALLEELLHYNRYINTDRVSALLLLMLWLEETKEQAVSETGYNEDYHPMLDYISGGNMFRKNKSNNLNRVRVYFPSLGRTDYYG